MTDTSLYAIFGAGGAGRDLMPYARKQVAAAGGDSSALVFVDDQPAESMINGHAVLSWDDFMAREVAHKFLALGIASGVVREKLVRRMAQHAVQPWSVWAPNVEVMDDVNVGIGATIYPHVTFTSNVMVGDFFHAHIYSYIAHDSVIGDFVTFAPRVCCNGNVHIGDHVYIGTGAILRQGTAEKPLRIGSGAVIGMGAVVTRDVPAGATVVGNPARPLVKE